MAEDDDEASKTEEPTSKKLEDAREKGNVPQSQEVKTWFMLLGSLIVVWFFAPKAIADLSRVLVGYFERAGTTPLDAGKAGGILADSMLSALLTVAVSLAVLTALGMIGTLAQIGWLVATERLKPQFSKLNPWPNLKRMFSAHNLMELGKSLFKFLIVGVIVYFVLRPMIFGIEIYAGLTLDLVLRESYELVAKLFLGVTVFMTLIAAADFIWQRYSFMKKMRMTKQEVKDEFKQSEGDPTVKGRLRSLRLQKARERMMANVPKADVVVTNPTHYAVALKYDPGSMGAPVLVAKGADLIARKIRETAAEHDIPLVSNPPLARALYASVEIDQEIPPEHYKAMAEVISYVFKLKGRPMPG